MANLEKLVKALEALKLFQSPIPLDDAAKYDLGFILPSSL